MLTPSVGHSTNIVGVLHVPDHVLAAEEAVPDKPSGASIATGAADHKMNV